MGNPISTLFGCEVWRHVLKNSPNDDKNPAKFVKFRYLIIPMSYNVSLRKTRIIGLMGHFSSNSLPWDPLPYLMITWQVPPQLDLGKSDCFKKCGTSVKRCSFQQYYSCLIPKIWCKQKQRNKIWTWILMIFSPLYTFLWKYPNNLFDECKSNPESQNCWNVLPLQVNWAPRLEFMKTFS